ncbi:hypothetical protein SAMN04489760_101129 [Syntrophus gentianae]|uniref:Alginate export domain-containing protein n=1 Tax=Syntrophus gentianae TaxID=43775 RepID=A0A1H7UDI9_9BACT|nr:hypothetical protein [Syntrophus gentianae]SEL95132.1 hypothetical protein SAMN04489760_101129 [Syntrophus gentianae]
MKKFWVALIAVALVAGFSLSASAADVKFSGSYYIMGATADNWGLGEEGTTYSSYGQRLRIGTEFKVAEGLTLNTRFDALEGRWGQFGTYGKNETDTGRTYGKDSENISFDRAWLTFAVPYGKIVAGRKNSAAWGTIFGNSDFDSDQLQYIMNFGPWEVGVFTEKLYESWDNPDNVNYQADADTDAYHGYFIYRWGGGEGGLKIMYTNSAKNSDEVDGGFKSQYWTFQPYAKAQFGPVFVEAELNYYYGDYRSYEDGVNAKDRDFRALNAYVHAKADIKNFYVGGLYAFVQGESYDDGHKDGGDYTVGGTGGRSWNPTLILWNEYSARWAGRLGSANGAANGNAQEYAGEAMSNAHLFQIYGGFKPIPKLDIKASVAYALADEESSNAVGAAAVEYDDDEYGWEVDLTAAYKIYDNLTYTVGFGYLFAGDYWQADNKDNKVDDTYLLMHKLDLVF